MFLDMTFSEPIREEIARLDLEATMGSAWKQRGDDYLNLDCWTPQCSRLRINANEYYGSVLLDDHILVDLLELVHDIFMEDPEQALAFVKSLKR